MHLGPPKDESVNVVLNTKVCLKQNLRPGNTDKKREIVPLSISSLELEAKPGNQKSKISAPNKAF